MSVKYGIRVPFDNGHLWVTEDSGRPAPNHLRVQLFDSREAAEAAAKIWKNYSVEEYFDIENFDWDNLANNQTS